MDFVTTTIARMQNDDSNARRNDIMSCAMHDTLNEVRALHVHGRVPVEFVDG